MIEEMLGLLSSGHSAQQVALQMCKLYGIGFTKNSVISKATRELGMPIRQWQEYFFNECKEDTSLDLTVLKIKLKKG